VLDPPTYGHGADGERWRIERDLSPLLANCSRLLANGPAFVLLTCHTPQLGPAELSEDLRLSIDGAADGQIEAGDLWLKAADGRRLHSGVVARWHRNKD
jgi:23S rRNA (cytosine1962-C5)-methyltransferase